MNPDSARGPYQPVEAQRIKARQLFEQNIRAANRCLATLPPHRVLLEQIARHGLPAAG